LEPDRPVWLHEVGAPAPHVPAEQAAEFARATIGNALDCPDVWGVTWWCSHDVDRALADFPELEYSLGLLTNDGAPKPGGLAIAALAEETRRAWTPPPPRTTARVLDLPEHPRKRSACAPGGAFFEAYMALVERGERPAVVRAQHANDDAYLSARGITSVRWTLEDAPHS
ncbi:MAG TPA: glycosyl hydrolase, partial [Actinospica sp.]|nr:glycosyl hydrolase [Actinospica sp.]